MKVIRLEDVPMVNVGDVVVRETLNDPLWVMAYDPDARNGIGKVDFTGDPAKAIRFPDAVAAWEFWRQQSKVAPFRDDGKPNRPLTEYTITIENEPV